MAKTFIRFLVPFGLLGMLVGGCGGASSDPKDASTTAADNTVAAVSSDKSKPVPKDELPASLKSRMESAIENVRRRELLTTNAFWTVFHGILGLGPGVALRVPDSDLRVNALDYIFADKFDYGEVRGMRFIPTKAGLDVQTGPQYVGQGHQDQFIAEIAQWGTPIDRKVVVYGKQYTMRDFVNEVMAHARIGQGQELSWAIVVVSQYIGTDLEWENGFGEKVKFDDVVRSELEATIDKAACGGTHRLFGLTWAYHQHLRRGGKPDGVWTEVIAKLEDHKQLAKKHQNPDGSFSTNYFRAGGTASDPQLRLGSSGHILEWLAASMSDDELREQWMLDAANAVSMMILDLQDSPMESGALYHAVHGLVMYYRRVFGNDYFAAQAAQKKPKQAATEPAKAAKAAGKKAIGS